MPDVSIVIPLYNKERDVGRAISSVLAQSFHDFELIVINDGSTDGSVGVVRHFDDPRIRLIDQANAGVSAARNRGVVEAQSGLVAFLDADDEWLPGFLATIVRLRDRFPDAGVLATGYRVRDTAGFERNALVRGLPEPQWEGILDDYFAVAARSEPPICSSSVAVQKGVLGEIGGFPSGVPSGEDLLTWARLAVATPIAYSVEPKAVFWAPENTDSRPGRFSKDTDDPVGDSLLELYRQSPGSGLRCYLGRWHEMRAVVALQRNRNLQVFRELKIAWAFNSFSPRHVFYLVMACFPGKLPAQTYFGIKRLHRMLLEGNKDG